MYGSRLERIGIFTPLLQGIKIAYPTLAITTTNLFTARKYNDYNLNSPKETEDAQANESHRTIMKL